MWDTVVIMSGAVYINKDGSDSHSLEKKIKQIVIPLGLLLTYGIRSYKTIRKYCWITHIDG